MGGTVTHLGNIPVLPLISPVHQSYKQLVSTYTTTLTQAILTFFESVFFTMVIISPFLKPKHKSI